MAYNPGISYRGEMLGQAIGQAGQTVAQSYSRGLDLKQQWKDRKALKDSYKTQAKLFGMDGDAAEAAELGDLQGFVEGTAV